LDSALFEFSKSPSAHFTIDIAVMRGIQGNAAWFGATTFQQIQRKVPTRDALLERDLFYSLNIRQIAKWFVMVFERPSSR
jgi:hypothetical protein